MRKQELHPRTEVIIQKQKNKSKMARSRALSWLVKKFPEAFDTTIAVRPLKKGIMNDILEHTEEALEDGISKSKLREAVVIFTRRVEYLASLKAMDKRVDLQGNEVEDVTEEESIRAATKLKKRVEKSARNARQNMVAKTTTSRAPRPQYRDSRPSSRFEKNPSQHYNSQRPYQGQYNHSNSSRDPYLDEDAGYSQYHHTPSQAAKPATVVVKNKARSYDPDAVARLKEKLGIAKKELETEEA